MRLILRCHICASTGFVMSCLGRVVAVMSILNDHALSRVSLNRIHDRSLDPGGFESAGTERAGLTLLSKACRQDRETRRGEVELFAIDVSAKLQKSLTVVYSCVRFGGCERLQLIPQVGVRHILNNEGCPRSFSPVASLAPATMRGGEKSVHGLLSRAWELRLFLPGWG